MTSTSRLQEEDIALAREEWHAVRAGVLQAMSRDHLTHVMIALEPTLCAHPLWCQAEVAADIGWKYQYQASWWLDGARVPDCKLAQYNQVPWPG